MNTTKRNPKSEAFHNGLKCPGCGVVRTHECNGETGANRGYCCTDCGEQWEAWEYDSAK